MKSVKFCTSPVALAGGLGIFRAFTLAGALAVSGLILAAEPAGSPAPPPPAPPTAPAAVNELRVIVPGPGQVLHLGDRLTIHAAGQPATDIFVEVADVANRKLTLYLNGIEIPGLLASYKRVPSARFRTAWQGKQRIADAKIRAARESAARATRWKATAGVLELAAQTAADKLRAGPQDTALQRGAAKAKADFDAATQELTKAADAAAKRQQEAADAEAEANTARQLLDAAPEDVELSFVVERKSEVDVSRQAWDSLFRPLGGYTNYLEVALAVGGGDPRPVAGPGGESTVAFQAPRCLAAGVVVGLLMAAACLAIIGLKPEMLRDQGNPALAYSLGRTQMAFWGVLVISCFAGIAAASGSLEYIPAQVLVLLGISAVTALSATIIGSGFEPTPASQRGGILGFFDDICIGDSGASFHRVQVVLWTVVLGAYFLANVLQMMSMPVFSDTLLVLMGISSGTYLGFKTAEGKFDLTAPRFQEGKLHTIISGGTGPYQWTVESDPLTAMPLAVKAGTQEKMGALAIAVVAAAEDGKLRLTVKDKAGAEITFPVEFKKMALAAPVIRGGKLVTTITGGAAPFMWELTGTPANTLTPAKGVARTEGELAIPVALLDGPATLDLKVQDQAASTVTVNCPVGLEVTGLTIGAAGVTCTLGAGSAVPCQFVLIDTAGTELARGTWNAAGAQTIPLAGPAPTRVKLVVTDAGGVTLTKSA